MTEHQVRTWPSSATLARERQLAWKLAAVAADTVEITPEAAVMAINRVTDAAAAAASLSWPPVQAAREQALRHALAPGTSSGSGAVVWGTAPGVRVSPEWAAWANGVAARELDFHDKFSAADYPHPDGNIPPLLAVAQHAGRAGSDLVRGIVAACEVQVSLGKGICLHEHKLDDIAHLGPSAAAGIGGPSRPRHRDHLPGDRSGTALHDADQIGPQG